MLIPSLLSCSKPPEYAEIEVRFKELVEASYAINEIFFGEGLATYERVDDPKSSTAVIEIPYTDENGNEAVRKVWYYYTIDDTHSVIAHRDSYLKDFSYAVKLREETSVSELKATFPLPEGEAEDGYYSEIYRDTTKGIFCYSIPYTEKHYDFYYSASDPKIYDYVRYDSPYQSIDSIKIAAEQVYSMDYLNAVYETMFVGTSSIENTSGLATLSARYIEYGDDTGNALLMKSNTYEPLIKEKRLYDFSTAEIVRKSNKNFVTIQIDSYLESSPDQRLAVKLTMVKQNNIWYLDSATY